MRPTRMLYAALACLLTAAAIAPAVGAADQSTDLDRSGEQQFIGTWRLVSFEARTAEGQVIYPFGPDAEGSGTFTHDGRVHAAVWKANRQPFGVNDQQRGTPEEYTAAMQGYITYLGTFAIDRGARTLTTTVEQSVFPNWNGTEQVRFYEFSEQGNRMELTTVPIPFGGTTIVGALVWERVERDR